MNAAVFRTLAPAERTQHPIGQLFWIPAYEHMETFHVVRPDRWDRTQSIETATFRIEKKSLNGLGASTDLFQRMPIPELKVTADEELLVKKAKRRPGVLIVREGVSPRRLANFDCGRGGDRPKPSSHVFAPVVSLRKEGNVSTEYPPAFIQRVKEGKLPEFIYLPPDGRVLRHESMAVLTQLQVHEIRLIEETDCALDQCYLGEALQEFWADLEAQLLQS